MKNTTQKTYEKFFEGKKQMNSYYDKVRKNPDVDFYMAGFDARVGKYSVMWTYKKRA